MFCVTASAVPDDTTCSLRRAGTGRQDIEILVALGPEETPAALAMADQAECALYCVATAIFRMPEFSALESAKSIIRALPPKETCRLGAVIGQLSASRDSAPAGQHEGHRFRAAIDGPFTFGGLWSVPILLIVLLRGSASRKGIRMTVLRGGRVTHARRPAGRASRRLARFTNLPGCPRSPAAVECWASVFNASRQRPACRQAAAASRCVPPASC